MRQSCFQHVIMAIISLGLLLNSEKSTAADVVIYTESYPPYNYRNKEGDVAGHSTAIVQKIMAETGLDYEIRLVPWGRGIRLASKQENALIYSILKSRSRDEQFHWLVKLAVLDLYLYGRKEETRTVDLQSLQQGLFRVVCTSQDAACDTFLEMGVPEASILSRADAQEVEARLVASGRADFFIGQEDLVRELGRAAEKYKDRFRKVMKAPDGGDLYLAGGKRLRPDIRAKIEKAYARLRQRGELRAISSRP